MTYDIIETKCNPKKECPFCGSRYGYITKETTNVCCKNEDLFNYTYHCHLCGCTVYITTNNNDGKAIDELMKIWNCRYDTKPLNPYI